MSFWSKYGCFVPTSTHLEYSIYSLKPLSLTLFFFLDFLSWFKDSSSNVPIYEDRTSRFFPSAPRVPRLPGVVGGDAGFLDGEDSFQELSNSSHQRFNILCSGDKDGSVCFSIFGIFLIGKIVSEVLKNPFEF